MLLNKIIIILISIASLWGISGSPFAFAAEPLEYNLAAPLPGGSNKNTSIEQYAGELFSFMLTAAAVLAFVMLVLGGIEYVGSAGNPNTINDAKNRITNALLGLLLAVSSYLILRTINPDLVKLKVTLDLEVPAINSQANNNGVSTFLPKAAPVGNILCIYNRPRANPDSTNYGQRGDSCFTSQSDCEMRAIPGEKAECTCLSADNPEAAKQCFSGPPEPPAGPPAP